MNIENLKKEILSKNNITIRILRDMILDMKSIIKKQNVIIAILASTTFIGILYFIFSKI